MRERDLGCFRVDTRSELLRFLDGRLRMRWCLASQHVHRCFRVVGEQDIFEGVCSEDRFGIQLAVVKRVVL